MKRPAPQFTVAQSVALLREPTTRHAKVERVVGYIGKRWMYQISYEIFDAITPGGSGRRHSQPFFENEIEAAL